MAYTRERRIERLRHFAFSEVLVEPVLLQPGRRDELNGALAPLANPLLDSAPLRLNSLLEEADLSDLTSPWETFDAPLASLLLQRPDAAGEDAGFGEDARHPGYVEWLEHRTRDYDVRAGQQAAAGAPVGELAERVFGVDSRGIIIAHRGPGHEAWRDALFRRLEELYQDDPRPFYDESPLEGLHKREFLVAVLRELQRAYAAAQQPLTFVAGQKLTTLPKFQTLLDRLARDELRPSPAARFSKLCYFVTDLETGAAELANMEELYGPVLRRTYDVCVASMDRLQETPDDLFRAVHEGRVCIADYLEVIGPDVGMPSHVYKMRKENLADETKRAFGVALGLRYWEQNAPSHLEYRAPAAAQFFLAVAFADWLHETVPVPPNANLAARETLTKEQGKGVLLFNKKMRFFIALQEIVNALDAAGALLRDNRALVRRGAFTGDRKLAFCRAATELAQPVRRGLKRAAPDKPSTEQESASSASSSYSGEEGEDEEDEMSLAPSAVSLRLS